MCACTTCVHGMMSSPHARACARVHTHARTIRHALGHHRPGCHAPCNAASSLPHPTPPLVRRATPSHPYLHPAHERPAQRPLNTCRMFSRAGDPPPMQQQQQQQHTLPNAPPRNAMRRQAAAPPLCATHPVPLLPPSTSLYGRPLTTYLCSHQPTTLPPCTSLAQLSDKHYYKCATTNHQPPTTCHPANSLSDKQVGANATNPTQPHAAGVHQLASPRAQPHCQPPTHALPARQCGRHPMHRRRPARWALHGHGRRQDEIRSDQISPGAGLGGA